MKASELLSQLSAMIEIYGDKEVHFDGRLGDSFITSVEAYNVDGNDPSEEEEVFEFYIHGEVSK